MTRPPVKKPSELSQRTFKLLHFKDKIEKKKALLESLLVLLQSPDMIAESTVTKISQVNRQWNDVCQPVIETYQLMKIASTGKAKENHTPHCGRLIYEIATFFLQKQIVFKMLEANHS